LGLDRFGASAPAQAVFQECGLTVEHIVEAVKEVVEAASPHSRSAIDDPQMILETASSIIE